MMVQTHETEWVGLRDTICPCISISRTQEQQRKNKWKNRKGTNDFIMDGHKGMGYPPNIVNNGWTASGDSIAQATRHVLSIVHLLNNHFLFDCSCCWGASRDTPTILIETRTNRRHH